MAVERQVHFAADCGRHCLYLSLSQRQRVAQVRRIRRAMDSLGGVSDLYSARRLGMQTFEAALGHRFTYIRGRHAWASCQEHVALRVCDRREVTDRLACLYEQWTNIDRGTIVEEEEG
jgi:hypothetical protein